MLPFGIDSIAPTHILVILTVVAVVYAVWAMYFIWRDSRRADGKEPRRGRIASQSEDRKPVADVMGKSKTVFEWNSPPKQAAVATEPDIRKANIFVSENAPVHPRLIPQDELDTVFGAAPEDETNEPLEIHHPLYVERPLPKEVYYSDDDENEALPLRGQCRAHGVRFEELGDTYHRVAHDPSMTETEEVETGRILLDLKPTDMFEYIVSGDLKRENTAHYLIDVYLAAFQRRMEVEEAENQSSQDDVVAPKDFNIFDNAQPVIRRPR